MVGLGQVQRRAGRVQEEEVHPEDQGPHLLGAEGHPAPEGGGEAGEEGVPLGVARGGHVDLAEAPEEGGEFKAEGPKPQGPGPGEALGEEPLQGHAFRVLAEKPPARRNEEVHPPGLFGLGLEADPLGHGSGLLQDRPGEAEPLEAGEEGLPPLLHGHGVEEEGQAGSGHLGEEEVKEAAPAPVEVEERAGGGGKRPHAGLSSAYLRERRLSPNPSKWTVTSSPWAATTVPGPKRGWTTRSPPRKAPGLGRWGGGEGGRR